MSPCNHQKLKTSFGCTVTPAKKVIYKITEKSACCSLGECNPNTTETYQHPSRFSSSPHYYLGSKITYTPLKLTASSPLKIGWNAPERKGESIPTIPFQGAKICLVSGNVIRVNDAICYSGLWRTFLVAVRWDDLANLSIGTHQLELIPSLKPSVAPENRVSQKESSLPTIDFQGLWIVSGRVFNFSKSNSKDWVLLKNKETTERILAKRCPSNQELTEMIMTWTNSYYSTTSACSNAWMILCIV